MKGDSINGLLQMQAYRRADMEGQIAKRDVYGETKAYVEQWRKTNGLEGTKALPNRNEVPFQWMIPFLDKVETEDTASDPLLARGFVKNVGEPMGIMSATQGMKIIDDTETNPLKKELRRIRMFKNNPIEDNL